VCVVALWSVGVGEYVGDITEGVVEGSESVAGTVIGHDLGRGDTQAGVEGIGVFPESGSVVSLFSSVRYPHPWWFDQHALTTAPDTGQTLRGDRWLWHMRVIPDSVRTPTPW